VDAQGALSDQPASVTDGPDAAVGAEVPVVAEPYADRRLPSGNVEMN
jgi:hypothetical protein